MSPRKIRVAWDMTHAARIRGGTGVYARRMLDALESDDTMEVIRIAQPLASGQAGGARKLGRGLRQAWWTQVSLAREVRRCAADLIHAPAYVSSLFPPCRLVVTIHDLAYRRYPQHYSRPWLVYLRLLVPAVVRRASAVIAVSHQAEEEVRRYLGVPAEKVHVVYHGVDHDRFRPVVDPRSLAATAHRYRLDGPFILHVGGLGARKNIPSAVEALGLLERARSGLAHRLVLVGEEPPGLPGRTAIEAAVERWGLNREVVFLGHVPDEDLPALYNLADLLVMPSLHEGFGLPVLEAMACGTPVVASNVSSLPEVAGDAGLLVPPQDTDALAEAIERVLHDAELRTRMIDSGLARAAMFTWEQAARQTVQVYRRVLALDSPLVSDTEKDKEVMCSPRQVR